jgi:hypothetical protein
MPRIARFRSTEIAMYFADLGRDGQAQVAIENFRVIARSGRIDLREALAWAAEHRDELAARWEELSGGG